MSAPANKRPTYDLTLFKELNREFAPAERRVVKKARTHDEASLQEQARKRAERLDTMLDLRGKRVLEVGCGAGQLCRLLAEQLDCDVVGVDIETYRQWEALEADHDRVHLKVHDITADDNTPLGTFDRIYSFAVWEHMTRPLEGIQALPALLNPGGKAYIAANLYRGQTASHRYREVFFPYSHLLFEPEVFEQFYVDAGKGAKRPAWVNKLTAAQYREQFARVGLAVEKEWATNRAPDPEFLERFSSKLDGYPLEDLTIDFLHAIVTPDSDGSTTDTPASADAHHRLEQIESSFFWRATEPLRRVLDDHPEARQRAKKAASRAAARLRSSASKD